MPTHSCITATDHRLVGDPVDTLTGAVVDRQLEFRLTGPLEFWWYRCYDSAQSQRSFAFGWGHTHEFDRSLHFNGDEIRYQAPVGRQYVFPSLAVDGDEIARYGFVLRRLTEQTYELRQHAEPNLLFQRNLPEHPARLIRIHKGEQQILFYHDLQDRLTHIIDSAGRIISVVQHPDGRLLSLTLEGGSNEPDQLLVAYDYDEKGNLVATRNGSGYGYVFAYDEQNRMVMRRGRMGFEFHFTYDDQGRCVTAQGDEQLYGVSLNYQVPGKLTKVTHADGGIWAYHFNSSGALSKIIDPLDGVQKFIYDEKGLLVLEVDPNENASKLIYDSAEAPVAKIAPFDYPTSLPEDLNRGDPHVNRVAANPAEYEYGGLLEVSRINLPDHARLLELPLPIQARQLAYTRSERNPGSDACKAPFDVKPLGVLWWPKPRYGRIFNDFGKLTDQRDEFGRQRHWEYDGSGNVVGYTDFDGGKWAYDNGSWHLLRGVTNPLGDEIRLTYTTNGKVASCVDAGGTCSEYRYDFKDSLIEVWRHEFVRDRYTRDAAGNLIAKHAGDGRELLRFEIGPGNLCTKRTLASGDEHTFQYDEFGRQINVSTQKDQVEFAYDALGNQILDKRNGLGVARSYQGSFKSEEFIYFDCFRVLYEWQDNSLCTITDPTGKPHQIQLLGNGLVKRLFSNGSEESSQYDNLGRCLFKSTRRAMGRDWSRRYHWSGEGELQRVDINGIESVRYEYDAAHRLRRRIINGMAESYELDRADNLIAQPGLNGVSLKQGNRLEAANGSQFFYNDRNHIVTRQRGDNRIEYAYDSRDQLVRVETEEGVWEAEYDAIGRRVRKTWLGKTTEYYWNQDQLIAEVSPAGRLRLYVYANPLALTPLLIVDYHSINAPPESGECYCVFSDQIGSPCLVEDEQGADVWRARIEPYGEAEIKSIKGFEFHFRFPGHYFDNEIGLHYNRFRYYDPGLGRYIQSDPWGLAGGYNLYGYFTNPLLQVDVQGLGEEGEDGCPPRENDAEGTPPPGSSGSQHAQSSLPAGAQSARDRIAQGKTVPPHVRYDPDGYYYDTKSSRYKSIPEPKPDFSQGPGNREIPCFCSGTLIATPGSFVRIENIKQGEIVSSWDADQQKVVEASVVALHKNRAVDWVEIVVCDEKITSTKKHRYWVRKYEKWIEARLLSVGMEVLLENGQYVPIDKLSFVKTQEKDTFNITVENTNTFYVGGSKVLVHNQGDDSNGKIYIGYNKDGIPIYVGQTKQTIKARQSQHRAEGVENPDSKGWKSDMEIKPVPGMDGLTDDQMDYHERRIHDELVDQGYNLKNSQIPMTDGKINKLVEKHC